MAISNTFKQSVFNQDTNEVFLVLLTISQADVATIRVVNNNEDVTSNGNLFTAFPFDIELPSSTENSPPKARLTIDNVSREIGQAIRNMTTVASVTIEVVLASDLDTVEITYSAFSLRNIKWDASKVSGDLVSEEIELEPFPKDLFTPANFPALFV